MKKQISFLLLTELIQRALKYLAEHPPKDDAAK